jgi:predicted component of type VI protein secretion system
MTAVCPSGHASATADYCDQCGAPIAAPAATPGSGLDTSSAVDELDTSPAVQHAPCPLCGALRTGDDRYCEGCGHDFAAPPPAVSAQAPRSDDPAPAVSVLAPRSDGSAQAVWEALVTADRNQFERNATPGVEFPSGYAARRFALTGAEVRIGRSRGRPGEQVPEVNLVGTPEDPAVSHLHAVLERQPDGSYALRDLGSTNGTTVNDDPTPIGREAAAPVADGDRIRIGAWTTLTLRKA